MSKLEFTAKEGNLFHSLIALGKKLNLKILVLATLEVVQVRDVVTCLCGDPHGFTFRRGKVHQPGISPHSQLIDI